MPLIFTAPPEALTTTAPTITGCGSFYLSVGPWKVGSDRYTGGTLNSKPTVAKRSGGIWTFPDSGNAPTQGTGARQQFIYDSVNGLIHILTRSSAPDNFLRYCAYDLSTDTYGTVVTSSLPTTLFKFAQRSGGGDLVVAYGGENSGGDDLKYVIISSGVLGSGGTLEAGAVNVSLQPLDVVMDSSDNAHIGYQKLASTPFPPNTLMRYTTLSSGNTPGTPATILTITPGNAFQDLSLGLIWNDRIIWLHAHPTGVGIDQRFIVGTPVSAPVWTITTVTSLTNQNIASGAGCVALSGSTVYIFFPDNNFVDVTSVMRYATYDGTIISAVDTAWDAVANPTPSAVGLAASDVTCNIPAVQVYSGVLEMIAQSEVNLLGEPGLEYLTSAVVSEGYQNHMY